MKHPKIVEWWIALQRPPPAMKDGDELVKMTNARRMREYPTSNPEDDTDGCGREGIGQQDAKDRG